MRKYLYCENGFVEKATMDAKLLGECRNAPTKSDFEFLTKRN